ncbi:MAG: ATP-binding protein, partial [Bacteroidales bacterium]|nr:ATP-binding protein [Bacteroidales bacterium]
MEKIISRENERSVLNSIYSSGKSEFVAIYGRRRVGKTFLIRSVFDNNFTFQITGIANSSFSQQLSNFYLTLTRLDTTKDYLPANDWLTAFSQLSDFLETKKGRKVIFIDELPWFDTRNSKFIQGLEHFWNSWASGRS